MLHICDYCIAAGAGEQVHPATECSSRPAAQTKESATAARKAGGKGTKGKGKSKGAKGKGAKGKGAKA